MNQNAAAGDRAGTPATGPLQQSLAEPSASQQDASVPDHELLCRIGGGSYGDVWLAKNAVGTLRAVKVVHRKSFDRDEHFEREFRGLQKFEPLSRSHDGFVDVLQLGRNEQAGYFYYVMELADAAEPQASNQCSVLSTQSQKPAVRATTNASLNTDHCSLITSYTPRTLRHDLKQRGRLPLADCLQIGRALADALAHLHAQGLVHRDIKPSNIIFVNGAPKLADIGLVTSIDDAHSLVGTVGYIPPEGPGSPQADVYSLGKVLYEAAFGKDRQEFPQLPADLQSHPDHTALLELNEVITQACDADPRRRYQSAADMRADLERLQLGQSVKRRRAMHQRLATAKAIARAAAVLALLTFTAWLLSNSLTPQAPRPDTQQIEKKITTNLDALNAYAQGRYAYNKNTGPEMTNAIRCFERAIALDPNFAEAYAGLASSYTWGPFLSSMGSFDSMDNFDIMSKARAPAEKAAALKPNLPEAHKDLAMIKYLLDWDWAGAQKEFDLALQLDPRDGEAMRAYGMYLKSMGRLKEAIALLTRAHELDPRSISAARLLGHAYADSGDLEQAMKQYQTCIDLEPNAASEARFFVAGIYEEQGLYLEAIDLCQQEDIFAGDDTKQVTRRYDALRQAYQTGGPTGYWQKRLEQAKEDPPDPPCDLAGLHARLGDKESAFECLEIAFQKRDPSLVVYLKTDRAFASLRSEPEYTALLRKMKWEK